MCACMCVNICLSVHFVLTSHDCCACAGNIVSDGRLVQDSGGIQNVHFGITKQGQLFTG